MTTNPEVEEVAVEVINPGFLVALKTHVRGGVDYLHGNVSFEDGGRTKRWETTRVMEDPDEREAATKLATKCAGLIAKPCSRTSFGLLCPLDREAELDAAVTEVEDLVTAWNARDPRTRVYVSAIKGRIADNDPAATAAVLNEVRELLDRMDSGIDRAADVSTTTVDRTESIAEVRDAAMRLKRIGQMVTGGTANQVDAAIVAVREAAKVIVRRGDDMSDRTTRLMVDIERETFDEARSAFLDTMTAVMPEPVSPVDLVRAVELDFEREPEVEDEAVA